MVARMLGVKKMPRPKAVSCRLHVVHASPRRRRRPPLRRVVLPTLGLANGCWRRAKLKLLLPWDCAKRLATGLLLRCDGVARRLPPAGGATQPAKRMFIAGAIA